MDNLAQRNGTNFYCYTTNGYVPKTEMCNDQDDRVVCPTNVPTGGGILATGMFQGVTYHSECRLAVTPNTLDDGAIAGIVMGVIVCLAFVVVMGVVCRRPRVTTVVHRAPVSASAPQISQGYTTTVTGTGGAMMGSQQAYPGGPPSYETLAQSYGPPSQPTLPSGYPNQ